MTFWWNCKAKANFVGYSKAFLKNLMLKYFPKFDGNFFAECFSSLARTISFEKWSRKNKHQNQNLISVDLRIYIEFILGMVKKKRIVEACKWDIFCLIFCFLYESQTPRFIRGWTIKPSKNALSLGSANGSWFWCW